MAAFLHQENNKIPSFLSWAYFTLRTSKAVTLFEWRPFPCNLDQCGSGFHACVVFPFLQRYANPSWRPANSGVFLVTSSYSTWSQWCTRCLWGVNQRLHFDVFLPTSSRVCKVSIFQLRHSPFFTWFVSRFPRSHRLSSHSRLNAFVIQTKLN